MEMVILEVELAPVFMIESTDFGEAEFEAIYNVLNFGKDITFGSRAEPKQARDSVHKIVLTGNAIEQIERGESSELTQGEFALGPKAIEDYKKEWDPEWLEEYERLPPDSKERFKYVYVGRLIRTYGDQLTGLRDQLAEIIRDTDDSGKNVIVSNRHQVITWDPRTDLGSEAPPCFQRAWIRYYHPRMIDLHLSWRSRDLRHGWKNNLIGGIAMFNKVVFAPNKCRIVRIIDDCDSLHIMNGDMQSSQQILSEAENLYPEVVRRLRTY